LTRVISQLHNSLWVYRESLRTHCLPLYEELHEKITRKFRDIKLELDSIAAHIHKDFGLASLDIETTVTTVRLPTARFERESWCKPICLLFFPGPESQ